MAKILLVEDDNNLREIYGARLMAEGFTIVAAADGEEALAMAVKEKPDLIISDVMMPKISGFDMLDILRTTAETKNTKVIMMTALSQPEDRARGEKLGADRYLVKSQVTLEDVVAVVHEVLGDENAAPTAVPAPTVVNPDAVDKPKAETPTELTETPETPTETEKAADEPEESEVQKDDVPEPASKKKKIIEPINDLNAGPDLDKLAAEEDAKENGKTPDAAIPATPTPDNQPDIAETIAEEKEEMEEQIKEFVDKTSADAPAVQATPAAEPTTSTPTPTETPAATPAPATEAPAPAPTTAAPTTPTTDETPAPVVKPAEPVTTPTDTTAPAPTPVAATTEPAPDPTPTTPPIEPTTPPAPVASPPADPNAPNPNDIAL